LNVLGVEFVDRPRGTSQVALHVDFEDPKGQESVDALFGEGDMIEVIEPHAEEPKGGA
jgi:hypothetical protein